MNTKDYIKKYNLDEFNKNFNKDGLMEDLYSEFIGLLDKEILDCKKQGQGLTPLKFRNTVDKINSKFWAISNKRNGLNFTPGLWDAFFAKFIAPKRGLLFPNMPSQERPKLSKS